LKNAPYEVRIDPSGSETIQGGSAGKYLILGAVGTEVWLERMASGVWMMTQSIGTTSFESP